MNARTQITMDPALQRRAQARAAALGISFAEYVRRLVAEDIGAPSPKADISSLFDLIDEGSPTDIARDKDKMIGEAVWQDYRRDVARAPQRKNRANNRANNRAKNRAIKNHAKASRR